jgi:hypothetical protein
MHNNLFKTALFSILVILLAGCGPNQYFSPQQAAIQQAVNMDTSGGVVDTSTVQVHQTVESNGKTLVVLSFNRVVSNRAERCLYVMEPDRTGIGIWGFGSGGGGCQDLASQENAQEAPTLTMIGAGTSSGNPLDPGLSHADGFVTSDEVKKVMVTWNDNTVQEATIENGTYFAVRIGQFEMSNVQAIDEDGQIIFDHQAAIDQGVQ